MAIFGSCQTPEYVEINELLLQAEIYVAAIIKLLNL